MIPIPPKPPTLAPIPPIHRMACPRSMGAMRRMGCPRTPTTALDAKSLPRAKPKGAEVMGNIKKLL